MNFRIHTEDQRTLVGDLISDPEIGWADVTLYNETTNEFVNGHLRHEIAIAKGIDRIPVLIGRWSPEKQAAIHAALDMSTGMAKVDPARLAAIIAGSKPPTDRAGEIVRRLAERLGVAKPNVAEDDGGGPPAEGGPSNAEKIEALRIKWGCEAGQLWQVRSADLARTHRVVIGDNGDPEATAKLFGAAQADIVFTSPPYDNQRSYGGDAIDWPVLMGRLVANLPVTDQAQLFFNLGLFYRDGEWVEYWHPFFAALSAEGWRRFGWYVWDQGYGRPADWQGRLNPRHEFIYHFNKLSRDPNNIQPCKTSGNIKQYYDYRNSSREKCTKNSEGPKVVADFRPIDTVIVSPRETVDKIATMHPAAFSRDLCRKIVESYSAEGELAYDPFLGSGTMILACEECKWVCFGCELNPGYVAIALERFAAAGMTPELAK